ncbi:MAG TPA: PIN domain-containing protein [Planctomycetaceae bacterium]|nr:PIN domain-containing protein [Planctomycetaceae bacterium]
MRILLDTNVLLRLDDVAHAQHADALAATEHLHADGHTCVLVPQVLYEFWVVATRPLEVNGLGLDVARVDQILDEWMRFFPVLLDERGVFRLWRNLVRSYAVLGKLAHDARLVAAMQRHGVTHLLTFNQPDFARFSAIEVLTPADVLTGRLPA